MKPESKSAPNIPMKSQL